MAQHLGLWKKWACLPLCFVLASTAYAAEDDESYQDHLLAGQITYNWQKHPSYHAAYTGPNSLITGSETMYTFSATASLGFRPWQNGELYFNPEITQGVPFSSNLVGLGGFTNGEITRAGGTTPKLYRQRLYVRHTWNQGGGSEHVDSEFNQMAGTVDKDRWVLTAGNFSTLDVFDGSEYAKDPRIQFMNWSHWTYAAYDYAADARGFGWGATLEWYKQDWTFRFGRMTGPQEPNGLPVDRALGKHYGDQIEVERRYTLAGQPGAVRLLGWRNRAVVASFSDALAWLRANPGVYTTPEALYRSRNGEKIKYGLGINIEQALSDDLGLFLRAMHADGRTETYAFTEVDGSLSLGMLLKGRAWGRAQDTVGLALARNTLSDQRRQFLEAGGMSFFIGDGALNYRPEMILESFYSWQVCKSLALTADYQRILNPAYNADRGPINVYALRLHADF